MKPDSLLFSIVRIVSGKSLGTGFLLDGGWVVTCAHNIPEPEHIELLICDPQGNFNTQLSATLDKCLSQAEGDLASLRITSDLPAHARPLVLTDSVGCEGKTCRTFGFPDRGKKNGLSYNSARIDSFDSRSTTGWRQMILTEIGPLGPGFSGSPLVETKHHVLVGMVLQRGAGELARGVPAEFIAARLGLSYAEMSPYPDLIERIDRRFLLEQARKEGIYITAEAFYTADPPAQWWGVMNGLVARKAVYKNLLKRINDAFYGSAPVLALLDGSGGMGKTTTARLLLKDLHGQFDCWWIDDTVGVDLDQILPEFLESRQQYGRDTLLLLDDWGKFSRSSRGMLLQFMRRQIKKGESLNIRFVITAKPDEHNELTHDLLDSNALIAFDTQENHKTDNEQVIKTALRHLDARFARLYRTLFNPEEQLQGKPFHLLFILLRTASDETLYQRLSRNLHNAAGKFRQVMQYDFDRLWNDAEKRGLAIAMSFAAYIHTKHNIRHLALETFISLANHYSSQTFFSPGQLLAAYPSEQWGILSHYLSKNKIESGVKDNVTEFVFFKKDEYCEHLLHLFTHSGSSVYEYLEHEKKLIVLHVLEQGGWYSSSVLAYVFSVREPLLSDHIQVALIEKFLSQGNSHTTYTLLFLNSELLPSIPFEQKWAWIKKFNEISPDNSSFHLKFIRFIKELKKGQWWEYVESLVKLGANSDKIISPYLEGAPAHVQKSESKRLLKDCKNHQVVCICLKLLHNEPEVKEEAKRLLREGNDPQIICSCLKLLHNEPEIKEEAKRLLKEGNDPQIICSCLKLLHNEPEVKEEAKRLLKETKDAQVICSCLNLLRNDPTVKEEAKRLLKEIKDSQVICSCLNLLRNDPTAREEAKRLLKESKNFQVICSCLNLLRGDPMVKEEAKRLLKGRKNAQLTYLCLNLLRDDPFAKKEARLYLKESKNPHIIGLCLKILCDDLTVKEVAKRLLKQTNNFEVICSCLTLLKDDPTVKGEAKRLLGETKDHQVICSCLNLLQGDPETKEKAKQFLKTNKNPEVVCGCLNLLRDDPIVKEEAKQLLKTNKNPEVICSCLKILKQLEPDWPEAQQICIQIIKSWESEDFRVINNCLKYLPNHPESILLMQFLIKNKWKSIRLYNDIIKYGYGRHGFWEKEVRRIVQNWQKENRLILGFCLIHLNAEPSFVHSCCTGILNRWEQECREIKKHLAQNNRFDIDGYFQKSLAHPSLRFLALQTAKAMFAREQGEPGFLTPRLRNAVYGIIEQGIFPTWGNPQEESMENE